MFFISDTADVSSDCSDCEYIEIDTEVKSNIIDTTQVFDFLKVDSDAASLRS